MSISVIGLDIAKAVFQIHGADSRGKALLRRKLKREQLIPFLSQLQPCLIGMEACSGAHHWAREFRKLGHEVKLIAPQFVKPFVKSNKNDAADAEAIAEAVSRPQMRFVPVKEVWQQEIQLLHRVRQRIVRARTALINELHGLLLEFGIALPRRSSEFRARLAEVLSPEDTTLSDATKSALRELVMELNDLDVRVEHFTIRLKAVAKENELCRRLQTIPGLGELTSTALVSALGDPKLFKNGRQFSAWLGLVPRQFSSGGKPSLGSISKRGDVYLRCLLVHGARSALRYAVLKQKKDRVSQWAILKDTTRGRNRAVVALANKNARIAWALMKSGKEYQPSRIAAA